LRPNDPTPLPAPRHDPSPSLLNPSSSSLRPSAPSATSASPSSSALPLVFDARTDGCNGELGLALRGRCADCRGEVEIASVECA